MPTYKLYYFSGRGRGEVARMVFAVAGVPYEDIRLNAEEWAKLKPDTVCGQVPELEVDGVRIPESRAIYRFLAREYEPSQLAHATTFHVCLKHASLFGDNNLETAKIEAACCLLEDFFEKIVKAKLRKEFQSEICGKYTNKIEQFLAAVNPNGDYLVGNKLTLADILFLHHYHDFVHVACNCARAACLTTHPTLMKVYENVLANENMQAWLKRRPLTDH
ncbi:Glutathione S-transferase 1 [Holothuria leucospilota]|uniref:Glutathione S-transferase 1 n=1 Tax=Holothuria leucospilota TaxID=206669 RepID=A0A9Q1BEZ6_HOLLE|nr:Glutathione S-transferase 1 [Holothuria leucospilota]